MTQRELTQAYSFLLQARSPFVRDASRWIINWDDPAPALVALSGDVGQRLGPFDTFRMCALLGLGHSQAVRTLGLDVLVEPFHEQGQASLMGQALAIAHAYDIWPDADRKTPTALLNVFRSQLEADGLQQLMASLGILCLVGSAQIVNDEQLQHQAFRVYAQTPITQLSSASALYAFETTLLNDDMVPHREDAEKHVWQHQGDDGGLVLADKPKAVRELETLRALALSLRLQRGSPNPSARTD